MISEASPEMPSLFSLIWKRKHILFTIAGLTVGAGIAYTIFAPAVWEAKATIVFPVRSPSLLGTSSFDQSSLAASLTGGPTPLKVFGGMLGSEHALALVAKGAGLSRRQVKDMRTLTDQVMESTITIAARDHNADLAKKVVQLHLDALQQINHEVSEPLASNDADVLKAKVAEQRKKVTEAEQKLLKFQNSAVTAPSLTATGAGKDSSVIPSSAKWGESLKQLELDQARVDSSIGAIDSSTHAIAKGGGNLPSAVAPVQKWREKLTDLQYELQVQQLTLAADAPEVVKLKKTIDLTRGELRAELNKYAAATSKGEVDKLPELMTEKVVLEAQIRAVGKLAKLAPSETIELARLTRDVTTEGGILQQIEGQYALAQLQSERDPNRWQVMDEPEVEDKPINKSASKNIGMSLILGLALGSLGALAWPKKKAKPEAKAIEPLREAA